MMKLKRTSATLFIVAMLLGLPCAVQAYPVSTVEIVNTGNAASETITVWGGGLKGADVYAGVYTFDKTAGTGEGKLWDNGLVTGFCTELSETVPTITSKYSVIELEGGPVPTGFLGGPMGEAKADYISELWGRFYDSSWASEGPFTWKQNSQASAFASAIWEIVYEDLPAISAKWDVTVDGTAGSGGFASLYCTGSGAGNHSSARPRRCVRSVRQKKKHCLSDFSEREKTGPAPETQVRLGFVKE